MPQCVQTLKLIGLAFNLWDGQKREVRNIFFKIPLSRLFCGVTITDCIVGRALRESKTGGLERTTVAIGNCGVRLFSRRFSDRAAV